MGLFSACVWVAQLVACLTFFFWFCLIQAWVRQNQGGRGLLIQLKPWNFFSVIFSFWVLFMHSYVIFNPNQEKNLLGYKVVDNSNYLNSVSGQDLIKTYHFALTLSRCICNKIWPCWHVSRWVPNINYSHLGWPINWKTSETFLMRWALGIRLLRP